MVCVALLVITAAAISFAPRSRAGLPQSGSPITAIGKRLRPEFVPGEILVRFKAGRALDGAAMIEVRARSRALDQAAAPSEQLEIEIDRFDGSGLFDGLRLARTAPDQTLAAVDALNARDDVLYAEPNYIVRADLTPNDPRYTSNELYGLNMIGGPQAWDTTTGNRNVVVAVIDEGVDLVHPDLQANVWTNPSPGSISGISGDVNGYNFRDNNGTIPAELHGTHVAGTIGAVGNNSVGVVGVNWQVSIMSLRFISAATGMGTNADALRAYNYAKQMRDLWVSSNGTQGANIRVINASFGGGGYSQADADAINALGQSGILFVAAAGNQSEDADIHPHYPSSYSLTNLISVAATTSSDGLAGFSNFGAHSVLMGAPGVGILSTEPGNAYGFLSGTSMATPHVTGAAALLCSANPNLSVNQLRALLAFNGDIVPALQNKTLTGRRLNVFKSLQALGEGDTTPPGSVTNLQITSQSGRSLNLSWVASGDDGATGQASSYDVSFVDQTSNTVVPLTTVPPAASGTQQAVHVTVPYRHTAGTIRVREFDNVGNEGAPATVGVSIALADAEPYTASLSSPAGLSSGGNPLGLTFDDRYRENYTLPFIFPFFGQSYGAVTISTNGSLYFSTPPKRPSGDADDVPSSIADLANSKMIAGMWDDLDLSTSRRADADVYTVMPDPNTIIFRWQGVQFGDGTNGDPVNFEVELKKDGTITTRYGVGNTNLHPVVGISGGEPDPYVIDSLTSETGLKALTNAQSAVFTPRSNCTFSLSPSSQSFSANGGSSSVAVTTQNGCAWTAISNAPWITINSPNGTTVNYSVAPNPSSFSRAGSMTIAGLTFNVTEDPATVQFSAPAYTVNESGPTVNAVVTRLGDLSVPASVSFATFDAAGTQPCSSVNGAASSRCDYATVSTKLTFAAGESSKTIGISIINDAFLEGNETFSVSLTSPTGAALGNPATSIVTIVDNDIATGPSPLTATDFFVRQHYLDFLNREPDNIGFPFWTNDINRCGTNQQCLEVHRINVSAAFFLSIEFQQTGYLIEKIYKTAYGDTTGISTLRTPSSFLVPTVRFNEFLVDTQQIGAGVIVGQGNWQQQLESNKQAFAEDFVQRSRFTSAFPASMSAGAFVDQLNQNANLPLSLTERNQLVSDLMTGAKTRAQALRAVAEHPVLNNSEFNRAFVLMQYFGYLRRNPNEGPDIDHTGYDFWLTKLKQFNGDFAAAEMVKAFLNADEYRKRFGQ